MPNDFERLMDAEQERISHLPLNQLPVLGGAAQTRLSWARTVEDFDALPPIYHVYMTALLGGRSLPYAVLTPTFAGYVRQEKEKLVFSLDDQLYIVERDGSQLRPTIFALANLNYVEIGSVLLKAWIRLSGLASGGALTSLTLKFNSVTERLFAPFLRQIRAGSAQSEEVDVQAELQKFDYLTTLYFKYRSFARSSVQPGERVVDSLLQPEMRQPLVTLFGRSLSRLVATAHLCILTDAELIIIRDDEDSPAWKKGMRQGGVWTYLPLSKISSVSLASKNASVLMLTIELPHGDRVESLFAVAQRRQVDQFLNQLVEWIPDAVINRQPA